LVGSKKVLEEVFALQLIDVFCLDFEYREKAEKGDSTIYCILAFRRQKNHFFSVFVKSVILQQNSFFFISLKRVIFVLLTK
jgi:hypothetical protein